jgi:hypothetical protein
MSPEERQLITGLFDRIRSAANAPRDPEADALIADAVKSMPYAPYFLAQAVIVQDQALRAANERLQQLEARLNDLEQQGQGQRPGGFLERPWLDFRIARAAGATFPAARPVGTASPATATLSAAARAGAVGLCATDGRRVSARRARHGGRRCRRRAACRFDPRPFRRPLRRAWDRLRIGRLWRVGRRRDDRQQSLR